MSRVVVITGASSGIGEELKNLFEKNGDIVVSMSRTETQEENHFVCDVSNEKQLIDTITKIGEKHKRIDLLINNAGFGMSGITELIDTKDICALTEVNYYGTLYVIRAALKYMNKGSRIVNISSAMALFPVPFRAIYGSVKAAVLQLSFSLRMELKALGIDVVAICPGDIKTNFTKNRVKDFKTNERYGDRLKNATIKSDSREEKRIPCNTCAKIIYKHLKKKKSRPFYIIGNKYKFLYFLTRITPKSLLLNMTEKLYGN